MLLDYAINLRHELVFLKIKNLIRLLLLVAFIRFLVMLPSLIHLLELFLCFLLKCLRLLHESSTIRAVRVELVERVTIGQLIQIHRGKLSVMLCGSKVDVISAICCVSRAYATSVDPGLETYKPVMNIMFLTRYIFWLSCIVHQSLIVSPYLVIPAVSLL